MVVGKDERIMLNSEGGKMSKTYEEQLEEMREVLYTMASCRGGFDIMSAIRGPDTRDAIRLKCLFTARIRAIVTLRSEGEELGLGVLLRTSSDIPDDLLTAAVGNANDWLMRDKAGLAHFLGHVRKALRAIQGYYPEYKSEASLLLWIADEMMDTYFDANYPPYFDASYPQGQRELVQRLINKVREAERVHYHVSITAKGEV